MTIQQSVSLPMFQQAFPDMEAVLPVLREIGFGGVEIWGRGAGFESLYQAARREGLQFCSMVGSGVPLNNTELHDKAEQQIRESIDIAARYGIPNLICFSGNRIEGQSDAQGADAIVSGFSRVAAYAEQNGVTLLLELLNSKVDHLGYLADSTRFGVEVCRRISSPNVRLLYDIYHMQVMEGDLIRTIQENHAWIAHYHTAGNPGRHEIGEGQEIQYRAVSQAIQSTGYQGFVGHEFSPTGDAVASLREAFAIFA
jgi:hydroxypyruvate isomerase